LDNFAESISKNIFSTNLQIFYKWLKRKKMKANIYST